MTPLKRVFDLVIALILALVLLPVMGIVALIILIRDGGPVLYVSERMKSPDQAFALLKFRTMTVQQGRSGVTGGDKTASFTNTGPMLRRTRLDELPQVFNVLKGDISFVGPRPPLRSYVDRFPDIYREVLKSRPGITGLATIYFHQHEEHLLASCANAEETDRVYARRCIPRKARLDLMYQRRQSVCFDIELMVKTVFRRLR
ncbi:sugar transferase [Roseovarius aestuarii]|nr:sugar transferase [Roseovarius aestuarii]